MTNPAKALVQRVTVSENRSTGLADLADQVPGASTADLDETPFVLIGTPRQMADQLVRQAEQLGINRYVVREPAVTPMERVLALLDAR